MFKEKKRLWSTPCILSVCLVGLLLIFVVTLYEIKSDVIDSKDKELIILTDERFLSEEKHGNKKIQEFTKDVERKHQSLLTVWNDRLKHMDISEGKRALMKKVHKEGFDRASYTLSITNEEVVAMVATKPGWNKTCHYHPIDMFTQLLVGEYYLKVHTEAKLQTFKPGDNFLIPKWQPHAEGTYGKRIAISLIILTPKPDRFNFTQFLHGEECDNKIFPTVDTPGINMKAKPVRKLVPKQWTATALLHPFSSTQNVSIYEKEVPFFQLSYAKMSYDFDQKLFMIHVVGCKHGEWWFKIIENKTYVSHDGIDFHYVSDMGWTFPGRDWLKPKAEYVGSGVLNWMNKDMKLDWWKKEYKNASTWFWFDRAANGVPFRIMFSAPPPSSYNGDPDNLAFFQMYAFSYIIDCQPGFTDLLSSSVSTIDMTNTGFVCGNPRNFPLFNWTNHFSMSAYMIPVDYPHNPYPTKVYYNWKEGKYNGRAFDRGQSTIFYNDYNSFENMAVIRADLFGHWEKEKIHGDGYLMKTSDDTWRTECEPMLADDIHIAQQPPWWPTLGLGEVLGIIQKPVNASDDWISPFTGSNRTVAIVGVTFPPHLPNYPTSTRLWTWYDYTEYLPKKGEARPIVFMQSAPKFDLGTSLALADFFDFNVLSDNVHARTRYDEENVRKTCNFNPEPSPDAPPKENPLRGESFFPKI